MFAEIGPNPDRRGSFPVNLGQLPRDLGRRQIRFAGGNLDFPPKFNVSSEIETRQGLCD